INIENNKQNRQKTPLSAGRIACEILAGTVTAAITAGLACSFLYVVGYGAETAGLGEGCMGGFALFAIMGIMCLVVPPAYGLASAAGVYLVGSRGNQTGSLLVTLGGSLLGLLVMALLCLYMVLAKMYTMLGVEKIVLWPLVFLASPTVAMLGFNLTRRYKEPPSA
ncbi:MAG: hypothetical protein ACYSR9_01495, partial [Planctomycetota bacterium]